MTEGGRGQTDHVGVRRAEASLISGGERRRFVSVAGHWVVPTGGPAMLRCDSIADLRFEARTG